MDEKARRLPAIADWINAHLGVHGFVARIEQGYCNTDRKIGRLRSPGKGRRGNRLIVEQAGMVVFDHNAAETYRNNGEVEHWLRRKCADLGINQAE